MCFPTLDWTALKPAFFHPNRHAELNFSVLHIQGGIVKEIVKIIFLISLVLASLLKSVSASTNAPTVIKLTDVRVGRVKYNGEAIATLEFKSLGTSSGVMVLQSSADLITWRDEQTNRFGFAVTVFLSEGRPAKTFWRVVVKE